MYVSFPFVYVVGFLGLVFAWVMVAGLGFVCDWVFRLWFVCVCLVGWGCFLGGFWGCVL